MATLSPSGEPDKGEAMGEARGQAEPSMEEILASIRRIISQESREGREADEASEVVATPAPLGGSFQPRPPADADVLLLTEMVADDGTVISLAEVRAAVGRASTVPPAAGPAPAARLPALPLSPGAGPLTTAVVAPIVPLGPADMSGSRSDDGSDSTQTFQDQQLEKPPVTSETEKKDGLVSQESRAAAAAAFSELTRHVARERDAALGGGRPVEDLVREALEPMLKNWLDTHLPIMVERIVRQEIQRVVRQAEDIA